MTHRYQVELVKQAVKEYENIPLRERPTVKKAILGLERTPRGSQVKKLEAREYYRLRVGGWRVIFAISDKHHRVTIIAIERRTSTTY
jgi:mRNA interferase RelE/StbE